MRLTLRGTAVLGCHLAMLAGAAQAAEPVDTQGPITLSSEGSPSAWRAGTITTGQMYVQYQVPAAVRHPPLVMIHGGGLSAQS